MNSTFIIPVADPINEGLIIFDEPNDGLVIATAVLGIMKEKAKDWNAHLGATEKEHTK